jgi:hypothetical protein
VTVVARLRPDAIATIVKDAIKTIEIRETGCLRMQPLQCAR